MGTDISGSQSKDIAKVLIMSNSTLYMCYLSLEHNYVFEMNYIKDTSEALI